MRNDGSRIFRVAHESGNVAHEYEPLCFQCDGRLRCGDVRVAIIDLAILPTGGGADDRCDAAPDALTQRLGVHGDHFAHEAQINLLIAWPKRTELAAAKNVRAGKPARLATQFTDSLDDFRTDLT